MKNTKIHNLKDDQVGLNDYIFSIYDNVAQIFEPPFTEKIKALLYAEFKI